MNASHFDAIVVGGGLLGQAIAYGLAGRRLRVAICDEGDRSASAGRSYHASRGNFGLVWVQGKGVDCPAYARLTLCSAQRWPNFAEALRAASGIDPAYVRSGGLHLCADDGELAARSAAMARLQAHTPEFHHTRLDAAAIRQYLPHAAEDLAGAIHTPHDGHANPLRTLHALHLAGRALGVSWLSRRRVHAIECDGVAYSIRTDQGTLYGERLVLAAGLGNARLAPLVGLHAPVTPLRGQVMITGRMPPLLPCPTTSVRQTDDGTVQIGDSQEAVGFDDGTRPDVLAAMARRAIRLFPCLRSAQVVRAWGALRVMTPDGLPIYAQSPSHPGAFVATCHSGVTLAAIHAGELAAWIAGDFKPALIEDFDATRRTL
jgi:glycine/D-amino acid oxidase-like deaminating enzyme